MIATLDVPIDVLVLHFSLLGLDIPQEAAEMHVRKMLVARVSDLLGPSSRQLLEQEYFVFFVWRCRYYLPFALRQNWT